MLSAYWARFLADGTRLAVKQRLCAPCYFQVISKYTAAAQVDPDACPGCGSAPLDTPDPVFGTLYAPGREPIEVVMLFDTACAAKAWLSFEDGAQVLPNRQEELGGLK